jgi:hypothetical protein
MKVSFQAAAILGLLVFGIPTLNAQGRGPDSNPYYENPNDQDDFEWRKYLDYVRAQQKYLEQTERRDRHMMQYRPYRKPQPDPYPPCCIPGLSSEPVGWQMNGGPFRRTPQTARDR